MKFWNDGFTAVFNYDKEDKIMKNTDQIKTPVDGVVGMNQVLQQRIKELKAENQRLKNFAFKMYEESYLGDRKYLMEDFENDIGGELISKIEKLEAEKERIEELEERIEEHVPSLPIIKAFEGK